MLLFFNINREKRNDDSGEEIIANLLGGNGSDEKSDNGLANSDVVHKNGKNHR